GPARIRLRSRGRWLARRCARPVPWRVARAGRVRRHPTGWPSAEFRRSSVMSEVTLTASTGRETGTRPSRRLRREDLIPGVVYGEGKDATVLSVDRKELRRALSTDAGQN